MNDISETAKITIDDVDYDMEHLSDGAKSQIANIQFSERQILQLQNELAISNTARIGYVRALKVELLQNDDAGG